MGEFMLFEHLAKKFGKLIDQSKLIVSTNLESLRLVNHDDSPNSPNFTPVKPYHYAVILI